MLEHARVGAALEHTAIPRPVVIRLVTFVKVPRDTHRRKITRRAVFARDGWDVPVLRLALEASPSTTSIPRSRAARRAGSNIVASCAPCNGRQGRLTCPTGANMHPRRQPAAPSPHMCSSTSRSPTIPAAWRAMAARDGRRGRRGLSGLDAGRPAGLAALGAGRGRRASSSPLPPLESQLAGQPPARLGATARELVAAPLGAAGLGARRPRPQRRARGARSLERLARRPAVPAPELAAVDPERRRRMTSPALLIARVPGAPIVGRPPLGPLRRASLAEIHAVDSDGIPPYRRYLRA